MLMTKKPGVDGDFAIKNNMTLGLKANTHALTAKKRMSPAERNINTRKARNAKNREVLSSQRKYEGSDQTKVFVKSRINIF